MKFNALALACVATLGFSNHAARAAERPEWQGAIQRAQAGVAQHWRHLQAASSQPDALDDDDTLESTGVVRDPDGREHVHFERRYKGLRVIGGDLVAHGDGAGQVKALSRSWKRRGAMDTRSKLSEAQAAQAALQAFPHRGGKAGARELIVWAVDGQEALAWDVVVEGQQLDGTPSARHHVVHAGSGRILAAWDEVHTTLATASGRSLYSGSVVLNADLSGGTYTLRDPSRGGHYVADAGNRVDTNFFSILFPAKQTVVSSTTGVFGNGTLNDRATAAADAAYGFQATWDYFAQVHQRNGIDGAGRQVYSRVHYGSKYNNAFWQNTCFCMTYGDGDGSAMKSMISLDVAGHEMAHGVTASSARLIYTGESGGLNEATSDIFGAMVEHHAANGAEVADYLVGERIVGPKNTRGYLRTMVNPSDDGASADCWYASVGSLDVHLSSGVGNHVFYLMAEGTSRGVPSRTCRSTDTRVAGGQDTVQGLGREKAERVWYRALTVYMTSNTNYAAARQATIKAATDLFGVNSNEVSAVAAAWTAVNVR